MRLLLVATPMIFWLATLLSFFAFGGSLYLDHSSFAKALMDGLHVMSRLWTYAAALIFVMAFVLTTMQVAVLDLVQDKHLAFEEEKKRVFRLFAFGMGVFAPAAGIMVIDRMVENRIVYDQAIDAGFIFVIIVAILCLVMPAMYWKTARAKMLPA